MLSVETLVQLLAYATREYGNRVAIGYRSRQGEVTWTYAQLWQNARNVAYSLHTRGIGPGERVLVYAPNSHRLAATYFGLLMAGCVIVPVDMRCTAEIIVRVREKARAHVLVVDGDPPAQLADVSRIQMEELPFDTYVESGAWQPHEPQPDDMAEIVFTSGTTGRPKGVVLTHRNITCNAEVGALAMRDLPAFRGLSILPLSHMFGQTGGLYAACLLGATIYYIESLTPQAIFGTLRERQITGILLVPQVMQLFWNSLLREVRRQGRERQFRLALAAAGRLPMEMRRRLFRPVHERLGGHLLFFICGGAHLPPELQRNWERLGVRVLQGYGTTECSPMVSFNTYRGRRPLGSVGRPLPNIQVRLAEDGEILVRGPSVFPGYWEDEEATRNAFIDGWYRTKDLGEMDARGYLSVRGRKDDVIVLPTGENVYPEDVETQLRAEAAIQDAVVFGLRRSSEPFRLHAVLLPARGEDGAEASEEEVARALKAANRKLALYQRIELFSLWPEEDFPRTHTMKVRRAEVLARLEGGLRERAL